MKRLVSLLLGLLMVFMISTAMAETVVVKPGDTLELQVVLSSASGDGAEIGIETNDAPVTFVNAVGGEVNDTVPPKAFNDFFVVVNVDGADIKPDGSGWTGDLENYKPTTLVNGLVGILTFMVDEDAEDGTYTVGTYRKSGTCTVEGAVTFEVKTSARIPGDVNDDGYVDMLDVIDLMDWYCGAPITINESNADVNADGYADMFDIISIMDWYCGGPVELL